MTVDDPDAALAANPATNPTTLAQLAEDRSDLRPILAANPGTPYSMLQWLHSLKDPAIDAALRRNGTAVALGLVSAATASPWAAPAGGPVTDAPPPAATAPPTIVMPVITPATTPPTVAVPVTASADPTPAAIPRPPDAALVAAGGRRRGGFGLVLVMIPLLFLGGCLAALALARGGSDGDDATTAARQATTAGSPLPTQETAPSTPTTAAAPPLDATTVPATEPAATDPAATDPAPTEPATAAPTPAPAPTVRTPVTTARSSATTVRAATATTRAATATTRATTATTRPVGTTVVRAASGVGATTTATPAAVQSFSFTIAQQFASALAAGDWARARTLGPSSSTSDANYRAQYGNLDASTVVPVRATALSVTKYSLRIGLVAHETNNGVKQTSLYCAHWDVDTAAGTVTQVDGTKVRTENGTKAAASLNAELTTVCATVALD